MNRREYYFNSINSFIISEEDSILGSLLNNSVFEILDNQKIAWREEIVILKKQLSRFTQGDIIFEYTIPRMGHRVDVICIIEGIIFLLEFKIGDKEYKKSTTDQVIDYALDLKYFHEQSRNRYIIPINVSTKAPEIKNVSTYCPDKIFNIIFCNENNLGDVINDIILKFSDKPLDAQEWINSKYVPTPTIVEAAQALYRSHKVEDISRNDAGAKNLKETTNAIFNIINQCKKKNKKAICFITGIPGAGKTLAGLNIANEYHNCHEDEHAIFLSGNGPLVDVLQNALAQDKMKREKTTKNSALRETKTFIQNIHKFRDEAITTSTAPIEKIVIFDEAQRAWDKDSLASFMKRKKGISSFNQSESDFLISIMDRHNDWALVICLIGGGQEIYNGEAGILDWFDTLAKKYWDWDIYLSDKLTDEEYVGKSTVSTLLNGREYQCISDLHLDVSLRSFRSKKLALFIKYLLDEQVEEARKIYMELKKTYPLYLTRSLEIAKTWVKGKARGSERFGILASSEGKRLRAEGIWVPTDINHVSWFLSGKDNINSSYYLEVAASEFKVQGLEIDYAILAWDADLRYSTNGFDYYKFRGTKWNHIKLEQRKRYLKNAYRVLLTRARQGLIIYIPKGNDKDPTRQEIYYGRTYDYLKKIGIEEV